MVGEDPTTIVEIPKIIGGLVVIGAGIGIGRIGGSAMEAVKTTRSYW